MPVTPHNQFVSMTAQDPGFSKFVDSVSDRDLSGKQPVFFAELYLILQILWEIYSWLKKAGFFTKWLTVYRVRKVMKMSNPTERANALQVVLDKL